MSQESGVGLNIHLLYDNEKACILAFDSTFFVVQMESNQKSAPLFRYTFRKRLLLHIKYHTTNWLQPQASQSQRLSRVWLKVRRESILVHH